MGRVGWNFVSLAFVSMHHRYTHTSRARGPDGEARPVFGFNTNIVAFSAGW